MMSFSGNLPPDAAGHWGRVVLYWPGPAAFWAKLEVSASARGQILREAFFPARSGQGHALLTRVPQASGGFNCSLSAARGDSDSPAAGGRCRKRCVATRSARWCKCGTPRLGTVLPGRDRSCRTTRVDGNGMRCSPAEPRPVPPLPSGFW
jgi:hypothetical protein